jgi:hypothetical protein
MMTDRIKRKMKDGRWAEREKDGAAIGRRQRRRRIAEIVK